MKTIKAIVLLGIIIAVVDIAIIFVMRIAGSLSADLVRESLGKSLSVIGIIFAAALVIGLIVHFLSPKSQ